MEEDRVEEEESLDASALLCDKVCPFVRRCVGRSLAANHRNVMKTVSKIGLDARKKKLGTRTHRRPLSLAVKGKLGYGWHDLYAGGGCIDRESFDDALSRLVRFDLSYPFDSSVRPSIFSPPLSPI